MSVSKKTSSKESGNVSVETHRGECETFWLVHGPPFDQRDYMISPSETPPSESTTVSVKEKKKLSPSEIKIDEKYVLDSQKALRKLLELIRDGFAVNFIERLQNLIKVFLKGSPPGFLVVDLPMVIEIVEYFSRNSNSVAHFGEFVKTIMCFASEPPKIEKASDLLHCQQTITDYFTLFGELLATFNEEVFQIHLLDTLSGLIMRQKLVDVNCIKPSFCHEAMEKSQLPYVIAAMMETVSSNLYLKYLDLALEVVWISLKAGFTMIQSNAIEFILRRMDPLLSNIPGNFTAEDLEREHELYDYYQLLDKSSYLVWGLFAIAFKYNVEIPVPTSRALWSLKNIFFREAKKKTQKAIDTRNNIAGIIVKMCAVFGDKLPLTQTGLVIDIAKLSVVTELNEGKWISGITFGPGIENYMLKKLMILCCCLFARSPNFLMTMKNENVIEGLLRLINPKTTVPWSPCQFVNLLFTGFRSLSELVPQNPETYLLNEGNARLLAAIEWIAEKHFEHVALLEALKTFCTIVHCGNDSVVEDAKAKGGIKIMLELCLRLLDVTFLKLEHQDKISRIFAVLEKLIKNDAGVQVPYGEICVAVSIKLLKRILANSENDSKWSSNLLVSFGGFLWEAVAWCSSSLKSFTEKGGVFLLLDFIEVSSFPVQMLFLGNLVDMTDEGETITHLLTWRGKNGVGVLGLMIDVWRREEFVTRVHRTKDGLIEDIETPLMTEEQWFLTHQVSDAHVYSPSVAEMVGSARPKIHALYQFLTQRYFTVTQKGEDSYRIQLKTVKPSQKVYIPLIEHYLALKLGEIWLEVVRDCTMSGAFPTKIDGKVLCTLIMDKIKWASRIKRLQEEISLIHQGGEAGEERKLYSFLKTCQLPHALEALHELEYVARSSFQKFQAQKRNKQKQEIEKSLKHFMIESGEVNIHRTHLHNSKSTYMGSQYVWVKSEKEVDKNIDALVPVSPYSCSNQSNSHSEDFDTSSE